MNEIFEALKEIICDYVEVDEAAINPDASLRYDIGATSFDLMNIADAIEERFNVKVTNNAVVKIKTVGDIAQLLAEKITQ